MKWNSLKHPPFFFHMDILLNPSNQKVYVHLSHPPVNSQKKVLDQFNDVIFSWKGKEMEGISTVTIKNWNYLISPGIFFQVNRFQWENMLDVLESYLDKVESAVDLYSGVGFFIPVLQQYSSQITGVESHGLSVNIAQKAFPGTFFVKSPVEKFILPPADVMVVDPPRAGLPMSVIQQIQKNRYKKLIYISCSSATFSRDLRLLLDGGYKIKDLQLIDLFPGTPHIESMCLLVWGRWLT